MNARSLAVLLAAIGTLSTAALAQNRSTQAQRRDGRPTAGELRSVGRRIVERDLRVSGESKDTGMVNMVRRVLEPLRRTAGYNRPDFELHVVDSAEFNAYVAPGGFMVVYTGLVRTVRRFAALDRPNDPAGQQQRAEGYLASVLGHELGHLTLGHTDSLGAYLPPGRNDESREARLERALSHPDSLRYYRHSRDQELAADKAGGLLMLQVGWEIQTALDLFKHVGALEREGPTTARSFTWLRDHPASSERQARLEAYRATLKLDQTAFDDARAAVRTGLFLDTALVLLDTVLKHFPGNNEAMHLRAAALHRKFIRESSSSALQVRSMIPTYDSRISENIRAPFTQEAETALNAARTAYRATLRRAILPYSLSNLAILDAYAGDLTVANARADSAVRLDSTSLMVRFNRGVVRFLAKSYVPALRDFEEVKRALANEPSAIVEFNVARARLAVDSVQGRVALRVYAAADYEGPWHDLAVALSGGGSVSTTTLAGGAAGGAANRPTSGIATPVLLGATAADVQRTLGPPELTAPRRDGGIIWGYRTRGVAILMTESAGAAVITLVKPTAGSIDGVRVGDPTAKAVTTWGTIADRDEDAYYFRRGPLVVAVEDDGGVIISVSIFRPARQ